MVLRMVLGNGRFAFGSSGIEGLGCICIFALICELVGCGSEDIQGDLILSLIIAGILNLN